MSDFRITVKPLSDPEMRSLGFTDFVKHQWYLCVPVGALESLNISIDKKSGVTETLVMDECTGQPAYYGLMEEILKVDVVEGIEFTLKRLREAGLEIPFDHSEYGVDLEALRAKTGLT